VLTNVLLAVGRPASHRGDVHQLTVETQDGSAPRAKQADGIVCDGVEDGLQVRRRTANDPKNLTGCRLPVERLLRLGEEADVLDGDDGLVGERLEESDLLVGEGTHFASADEDGADGAALAQEGSAERRAPPEPAGDIFPDRKVISLGQIFDVDNPRLAYSVSGY
jgi:hypothetical protein